MSRMLVIGGTGFLGSKLLDLLRRKHQVLGTCHRIKERGYLQLDITNKENIDLIKKVNPEIVIHTAAITSPSQCEMQRETAWTVNVLGTENVTKACKEMGSKLVYISSDYIFNTGKHSENSIPNPPNFYGQTKLEGERVIKEELADYLIIRPTAMYGFSRTHDKFLSKVRASLSEGKEVTFSPDIVKYPILVDDVAKYIQILIEANKRGTHHISGPLPITRFDWARLVASVYSLNVNLVLAGNEDRSVQSVSGINLLSTKSPLPKVTPPSEGIEIAKMQEKCILKPLYFKDAKDKEGGGSIAKLRKKLGTFLAKESMSSGDIVCPIPVSGFYYAIGFSEESGIPLELAVEKERSGRTLFEEKRRLIVIGDLVRDKKIILVDEAVFTGKTLRQLSENMRREGAREIHARIIYSPLKGCPYRVLEGLDLVSSKDLQILAKELGLDSIRFLSPRNYPNNLKEKCKRCWLDLRGGSSS